MTNSWLPAGKAVKVYNGRCDVENRIKEGKNTLRWDKTRRHRFAANQARLLMHVLASNLLHMLRQFYLMSEEAKRSMEWLIKRLVKVGARIAYHARKWYVHVASAFSLARYCQVALGLRAVRIFWLTESHMARYAQERVNKALFVDATMVLPCCCPRSEGPSDFSLGARRTLPGRDSGANLLVMTSPPYNSGFMR